MAGRSESGGKKVRIVVPEDERGVSDGERVERSGTSESAP